jgi:phage-related protein
VTARPKTLNGKPAASDIRAAVWRRSGIRVLYFFNDDRIGILLHGFTKDTAAVPVYDKNVAGVRMKDHIIE